MNRLRPAVASALLTVALSMLAGASQAQIPDEFTNLKVLDKGTSKRELVGMMREFAGALGVRCNFCHVGNADGSLEGMDFASDDKPEKQAARVMMRMTGAINADYVSKLGGHEHDGGEKHEHVRVQCMTCHRGQEKPFMLQDVLAKANEEGGMDALTDKYKALRDEYYGRATYDFGPGVLNEMAEKTARAGDLDSAKGLVTLNLQYNPDSAYSYLMMGQIEMQTGNKDAAIAAVKKALELEPDNEWAQRTLARMEKME